MSKNYVRMPVRFVEGNKELLKSQVGTAVPGSPGWAGQRHGDHWRDDHVPTYQVGEGVQSSYRAPAGRENGNCLFRRYANGVLDIEHAKDIIVDAVHRAKDSGGVDQLNTLEKMSLSVLFPAEFTYVDSGMVASVATVQLRLSPMEVEQIRMAVARHLAEEMNYNAGLGGGSVPGRSTTRF